MGVAAVVVVDSSVVVPPERLAHPNERVPISGQDDHLDVFSWKKVNRETRRGERRESWGL